jgi:3-deoxy-manno-octulosonate cytidylyltransferase (CMP-KDO synthetase)
MTSRRHRSGTDRIDEVMRKFEFRNSKFGIVVNIQGDEPLVDPRAIDRLVEGLEASPGAAMATLVGRFADRRELASPHTVKVVLDGRGDALYFSRSAIPYARGPGPRLDHYYKHIGIYAYRSDFLRQFCSWGPGRLERAEQLEQLRALEHGARIRCLIIGRGWPAVDTPQDLARLARREGGR